ncbi:MAG: DEAD/DEAH box helicase [Clostridia bacterium]
MKFNDLKLPSYIMEGLNKQGFSEATEIQSLSIPLIHAGKDIIGLSQTGSGKTYAYGIPAIEMIDEEDRDVQVLIICPTRELTSQVTEEMRKLTTFREGARLVPIFGGSDIQRQIQSLKKNAKIIVGTPGRLMDHLQRRTLKLGGLKLLVLDEADEMLNMGFREDIETILKTTNNTHQTIMFSATMPKAIMDLTRNYMKNPITVKSSVQEDPQTFIKQYFTLCGRDKKTETLTSLMSELSPNISIVFCNTKRMVDKLTKELQDASLPALGLHGDMRQSDRKKVMDKVKKQGSGILVATDVAARGIDIKDVDIVFNYDLPNNTDYYVHRIGRTARAGKEGSAYTLLNTRGQLRELEMLEKETKNKIIEHTTPFSVVAKSVNFEEGSKPASTYRGGRTTSSSSRRPSERTERKPYGERTERKPYAERTERKPYAERTERKPYAERTERKPYAEHSERKPYAEHTERKPYGERTERKPYGERTERKPFEKSENYGKSGNKRSTYRRDSESTFAKSPDTRSSYKKSTGSTTGFSKFEDKTHSSRDYRVAFTHEKNDDQFFGAPKREYKEDTHETYIDRVAKRKTFSESKPTFGGDKRKPFSNKPFNKSAFPKRRNSK